MGRYYQGSIEGKFWFAVQPSDCANRFGVYGVVDEHIDYLINYEFEEEDLESVEEEILNIQLYLGDKYDKLNKFFDEHSSYNDLELEEIGISKFDLREFADLLMGIEIRDCIIENGYCHFQGELQ